MLAPNGIGGSSCKLRELTDAAERHTQASKDPIRLARLVNEISSYNRNRYDKADPIRLVRMVNSATATFRVSRRIFFTHVVRHGGCSTIRWGPVWARFGERQNYISRALRVNSFLPLAFGR